MHFTLDIVRVPLTSRVHPDLFDKWDDYVRAVEDAVGKSFWRIAITDNRTKQKIAVESQFGNIEYDDLVLLDRVFPTVFAALADFIDSQED